MSLDIRVLTFNFGNVAHTQSEWLAFAQRPSSVWHKFLFGGTDIGGGKADVYAIALQEVPQSARALLGRSLARALGGGYRYMYERSEALGDFGVELHLIVAPSVLLVPEADTQTAQTGAISLPWSETRVAAHKPFFAQQIAGALTGKTTKATVGIAFDVLMREDRKPVRFVFLSSHLPVDTKDPIAFGLDARIDALAQAEQQVVEPLLSNGPQTAVVFWAGDLNFRHEPKFGAPIAIADDDLDHVNVDNYVDQLDRLLAQQAHRVDRYRESATPRLFRPTCKYAITKDNNSDARLYKSTRIPSYCDRILYRVIDDPGSNVTVRNKRYDAIYENESMRLSDHNAVFAEFAVSVRGDTQ